MKAEQKLLILIVDDNHENLQVLGNTLREKGYRLGIATNGQEALVFAQKKQPDLILLDIMMPGMDGFEACRRLKSDSSTRNIPVVFLTAKKDIEVVVKGFDIGAVDYVSKPFNSKELLVRVKTQLDLAQAVAALRQAKEEAENATKLKDKFVSLVAHDLKAPFTSILGFLSMVYEDKEDPLSENHKKMVGRSLESGERLVNMIQDLLEISRFQTSKLSLKKKFFDGSFHSASAVASLSHLAVKKEIILKNEVPPGTTLYGDGELFEHVLQNLVSNAIKFCAKGDIITLLAPPDREATIAVKDTGIGINEERLTTIFKHEESTSTRGTAGEKGTGFGLPFSKDIMQSHGGTLTVESVEGKGSVFYASLPPAKPGGLLAVGEKAPQEIAK